MLCLLFQKFTIVEDVCLAHIWAYQTLEIPHAD